MMLILGVDPGRNCGWCLLEVDTKIRYVASGTIQTPRKYTYDEALAYVWEELRMKATCVSCICVESGFIGKGVLSAMKIGEMRGLIKAMAFTAAADVCDFGPGEVKMAVTGQGNAKKPVVARFLACLGIVDLPDLAGRGEDETDAIAIAYCYSSSCLNACKAM